MNNNNLVELVNEVLDEDIQSITSEHLRKVEQAFGLQEKTLMMETTIVDHGENWLGQDWWRLFEIVLNDNIRIELTKNIHTTLGGEEEISFSYMIL